MPAYRRRNDLPPRPEPPGPLDALGAILLSVVLALTAIAWAMVAIRLLGLDR